MPLENFIQGDTIDYTIYVKDDQGNPQSLVGCTLYFTIKDNLKKSDAEALLQVKITNHDDPTAGQTSLHLAPGQTSLLQAGIPYFYDFQLVTAGLNVYTLETGKIFIEPDVTKSITL